MRWNEFVRAVNALEAEATALEGNPEAEVVSSNLVSTWMEGVFSGVFLTKVF
ncbi:MAG: hypothetical protein AB8A37_00360 [Prochlorococcus sp.]|jgi:hypothetical protein|tara:strand:+ start:994 stop:1149 length:156 start_codon:yes stop_codon:yes gene_type:complete